MSIIPAVIGTPLPLAYHLIEKLTHFPIVKKVIIIDRHFDKPLLHKTSFVNCDPGHPLLVDVLQSYGVNSLISLQSLNGESYHKLTVLENILHAASLAEVKYLIIPSTSFVYPPDPGEPHLRDESDPISEETLCDTIRYWIDAERLTSNFILRNRRINVAVLRTATVPGYGNDVLLTPLLSSFPVYSVAGFDPLFQLCDTALFVEAVVRLLLQRVTGLFNLASPGVLSYSQLIALKGCQSFPIPASVIKKIPVVAIKNPRIPLNNCLSYLKFGVLVSTKKIGQFVDMSKKKKAKELWAQYILTQGSKKSLL